MTEGTESPDGLRLPRGMTGVVLSLLLAGWSSYSLGQSPLQAGLGAMLSVVLMTSAMRDSALAASFQPRAGDAASAEQHRRGSLAVDAALCVAVMLVAALPRLVALGDIPPGLHGDEAIAGIEARRILEDGAIGPYSREALGVPAGTFYWTAAVIAVAGESVVSVRLAFAAIGIATVGVLFTVVRIAIDRQTGVIASLLLAFLAWHLHYSRIAFIPIGMPLFILLTLACALMMARKRSVLWAAATGLSFAGGLYTYQGYVSFAIAFVISALAVAVVCYRRRARTDGLLLLAFLLLAVMTAVPLIRYADANSDVVFGRFKTYSVFRSEEFKARDGVVERALFLAGREADFLQEALATPRMDGVEGAGLFRLVDGVSLMLAIAGIGIALARVRAPAYLGLLALTVLIAFGPMLVTDGWYRRSLGLAPLIAVLAALPLSLGLNRAQVSPPRVQFVAGAGMVVVLAAVAYLNLGAYFTSYRDDPGVENLYGYPFVGGLEELKPLDNGVYVYLFSERISYNHPDRVFFAPDNPGEDRSTRFGPRGFSLAIDQTGPVFFLFLDDYRDYGKVIESIYPGGRLVSGLAHTGEVQYFGYYLAAHGVEDTKALGAVADERRRDDLRRVAAALVLYRQEHGAYPSTQGRVQTACKFQDLDLLCRLPLTFGGALVDGRGDPEDYGYWYGSDGRTFTLYASMENAVEPPDACEVAHLAKHEHLYCLKGE